MTKQLLNPAEIGRLANLQLRAIAIVEGFLTGLHKSPYHGFSVEFSQHRPYMPGDALKQLDYKVLAKTGRYYVKQFEEETNLKAYLLIDHSASMGFQYNIAGVDSTAGAGEDAVTKLDYSLSLAAALSLLLLRQRDAVGLVTFAERVTGQLPPKSAFGWLDTLLTRMEALEPAGQTQVAAALFDIAERVNRKGMIILISDLLDEPEQVLGGLRALRHLGHDVIVLQVLNPLEVSFSFPRDARFRDLETQSSVASRPWHVRDAYRAAMSGFLSELQQGCESHGIAYELCLTNSSYHIALLKFLDRRRRMM